MSELAGRLRGGKMRQSQITGDLLKQIGLHPPTGWPVPTAYLKYRCAAIVCRKSKRTLLACVTVLVQFTLAVCSGCDMRDSSEEKPGYLQPLPDPTTSWRAARDMGVSEAMNRLHMSSRADGWAISEHLEPKVEAWQHMVFTSERTPSANDFLEVSDAIHAAATKHRVESTVTIYTYPDEKATVKYQTYGERLREWPPTPAKDLTECRENMAIGWYYIWSERQGEKTSDDGNLYKIVSREESVELREYDGR